MMRLNLKFQISVNPLIKKILNFKKLKRIKFCKMKIKMIKNLQKIILNKKTKIIRFTIFRKTKYNLLKMKKKNNLITIIMNLISKTNLLNQFNQNKINN